MKTTPTTPWMKPAVKTVVGKPIDAPPRTAAVQAFIPEIVKGMGLTIRHFLKNTKEVWLDQRPDFLKGALQDGVSTIHYPEEKRPYPERFRGLHRLTLREDGSPRCVACLCCSTACPAQCISIEAAEYPVGDARRGYERFPETFVIDELRCIFCGFCVEACPVDAIRMDTGKHAVPYDSREQFIYDKAALLSFESRTGDKVTSNKRLEPGDAGHPGVEREHGSH